MKKIDINKIKKEVFDSINNDSKKDIIKKLISAAQDVMNIDEDFYIECLNLLIKYEFYEAYIDLGNVYRTSKKYFDIKKAFECYTKAIEHGEVAAYNDLGIIYEYYEEYLDLDLALKCYRKAMDSNVAVSYYNYARMHHQYPQYEDIPLAVSYYEKAAKLGYKDAYINLGNIFQDSDPKRSMDYYDKSGKADNPVVLNNKGKYYLEKADIKDVDLALKFFKAARRKGYSLATYNIAYVYFTEPKYEKFNLALKYYKEFIQDKEIIAYKDYFKRISYINMGWIYRYVDEYKNIDKAIACYKNADNGLGYANLASLYTEEKKDYKLAFKYLIKALEQKVEVACLGVEIFIQTFKDIKPKDLFLIIDLLENMELSQANDVLGNIYGDEDFEIYDIDKAYNYYKKAIAIDPNNAEPYFDLGLCYYYGNGVKQSYIKAKESFIKARELGYECDKHIERVNNKIKELNIKENDSENIILDKSFDSIFKGIKVDEEIKVMLKTALIIYNSLNEQENLDSSLKLDYSPCITLLYKALENIIKKYFIREYRNYLIKNVKPVVLKNNEYFVKEINGEYTYYKNPKFTLFTLQDFKKITGYGQFFNGLEGPMASKIISSYLTRKDATSYYKLDEPLLQYAEEVLFNKDAFDGNDKKEEISSYLVELNKFVATTSRQFRNPATHSEIMGKDKAQYIVDSFFYNLKIIPEFYKKINQDLIK